MVSIRTSGWLLVGGLLVLLLSPPAGWAQIPEDEERPEDPPAAVVPLVRTTKNGTVIDEGEPPARRRIRPEGYWPEDVSPPEAEPDPVRESDEALAESDKRITSYGEPSNVPASEAAALKVERGIAEPFLEPSSLVLHSGAYRVLSVVGSIIDGTFASGGIASAYGRLGEEPAVASLQQAAEVPTEFALEANYPNPFNPETTIRFALPQTSHVVIEVFDILGREVARLVDRELEAGHHSVAFEAGHLSSGIYIYQMVSGAFKQHRTMLLVK